MTKSKEIRNLKAFIRGYVDSEHGKKVINRQSGHIPTGKTYKASFASINKNGHVVHTRKDVRETLWRNPALAEAMARAVQ